MAEIASKFNFKELFSKYKEVFFDSKKYWILYLVFITLAFSSMLYKDNILHPSFELMTFFILAILGIFCILFYFLHNDDKELYKVAFVIILCFGIICSFMVPVFDHSDEKEHFVRSEITSQGVIIPHWTGKEVGIDRLYNLTSGETSDAFNWGVGFKTIGSVKSIEDNTNNNPIDLLKSNHDNINHSTFIAGSAFEQNPFYGYLPQAIGISVAKLLDLDMIWLLMFARIFNMIGYAILIAIAVKITPVLKIPIMTVSCIPVAIFQVASTNIDMMIFGLSIIAIAYFIYLHQSDKNSIENKHLIIFSVLCLLAGLCKLPYLALIFLILLVPRDNFKNKNILPFLLLSILIVGICGVLWSRYATPALMHSWRSSLNYVNSTRQLNYVMGHPFYLFRFAQYIFGDGLYTILKELIYFNYGSANTLNRLSLILMSLEMFLTIVLFAYPAKVKFDLKTKIGALAIVLVIYVGTCFIQLLTWAYVGKMDLGIHIRYFLPLFCLIPIIVQLNHSCGDNRKFDNYVFVFIIGFMASFILALATKFF